MKTKNRKKLNVFFDLMTVLFLIYISVLIYMLYGPMDRMYEYEYHIASENNTLERSPDEIYTKFKKLQTNIFYKQKYSYISIKKIVFRTVADGSNIIIFFTDKGCKNNEMTICIFNNNNYYKVFSQEDYLRARYDENGVIDSVKKDNGKVVVCGIADKDQAGNITVNGKAVTSQNIEYSLNDKKYSFCFWYCISNSDETDVKGAHYINW